MAPGRSEERLPPPPKGRLPESSRPSQALVGTWTTAARDTSRQLISSAAAVGEDLGSVSLAAVQGAIGAAKSVGVDAEKTASAVATGAIEAAYDVSDAAGDAVRDAATGTIQGVRVVVESATSDEKEAKA